MASGHKLDKPRGDYHDLARESQHHSHRILECGHAHVPHIDCSQQGNLTAPRARSLHIVQRSLTGISGSGIELENARSAEIVPNDVDVRRLPSGLSSAHEEGQFKIVQLCLQHTFLYMFRVCDLGWW